MNIEEFREYCLGKSGVTEELPFGDNTLVFKVLGKMFALTSLSSDEFQVNLKCDPEKAIQLRELYVSVKPGYHMNKQHWNTVYVNSSISRGELCEWIDDSYSLVVAKLTKVQKQSLAGVPL